MADAARLHRDSFVMDGLVYHRDGWTGDLRAGGVDAINLTVCHFEADFAEACAQIAVWHGILEIGRASCRERGGQYVKIEVVDGALKKKNEHKQKVKGYERE